MAAKLKTEEQEVNAAAAAAPGSAPVCITCKNVLPDGVTVCPACSAKQGASSWWKSIDKAEEEKLDQQFLIYQPYHEPLYYHDTWVYCEYQVRALKRAQKFVEQFTPHNWYEELYYIPRGSPRLVELALSGAPPVVVNYYGHISPASDATRTVLMWFIGEALLTHKYLSMDDNDTHSLSYCEDAIHYYAQAYRLTPGTLENLRFTYDLATDYEKRERNRQASDYAAYPTLWEEADRLLRGDDWPRLIEKLLRTEEKLLRAWEELKQKKSLTRSCGTCWGGTNSAYSAYSSSCTSCRGKRTFQVSYQPDIHHTARVTPPSQPTKAPALVACTCGQLTYHPIPLSYRCEKGHKAQEGKGYCNQDGTAIHVLPHVHYCLCSQPVPLDWLEIAKTYSNENHRPAAWYERCCTGCGARLADLYTLQNVPNTPAPVLRQCRYCGTKTWCSWSLSCGKCLAALPPTRDWLAYVASVYPLWLSKLHTDSIGHLMFYRCDCGYTTWNEGYKDTRHAAPRCLKCYRKIYVFHLCYPSANVLPVQPVPPPMQESLPARTVEGTLSPAPARPGLPAPVEKREVVPVSSTASAPVSSSLQMCKQCGQVPVRHQGAAFCETCVNLPWPEYPAMQQHTALLHTPAFGFQPRKVR